MCRLHVFDQLVCGCACARMFVHTQCFSVCVFGVCLSGQASVPCGFGNKEQTFPRCAVFKDAGAEGTGQEQRVLGKMVMDGSLGQASGSRMGSGLATDVTRAGPKDCI